jgi:PKD repeat protein
MSEIVKWEWDFGDGSRSFESSPYHFYATPGFYSVTLKVTNSYGEEKEYMTGETYISVYGLAGLLFDFGNTPDKQCLVFGMSGAGGGTGWSEYSGDGYIWPESKEALVEVEIGDDRHKIAFDFDTGLPFIINTSERDRPGVHSGKIYRDKVGHPDEIDGFPIVTTTTTAELIGESRKYRIKHEETFADIRPVDKDEPYQFPLDVNADLIIDGSSIATERIRDLDSSREILFTNKDMGDRVQVSIETSESGFKLTGIESTCVVSDNARYASQTVSNDIDFQAYIAGATKWHTRPGAFKDRATGSASTPVVAPTLSTGADGFTESGFILTQDALFDVSSDKSVIFWYPVGVEPVIELDGIPIIPVGNEVDGWFFAVIDIDGVASMLFETGSHLFDLRFFSEPTDDVTYFDLYTNDVTVNNGEKFLPGYIE